jgi:release factor glutamine methyltransferase
VTTISELLRRVDGDEARRDVEVMVGAALGVERAHLYAYARDAVGHAALARIEQMLADYSAGMPVAYITGQREFWNLVLDVSPDVLIPRPETELLVELALERLPSDAHMLELGTGSGAIALAIARQRRDLWVTATDVSAGALAVAERNAAKHGLVIAWATGDWYAATSGSYDLVVSNPPYVRDDDPHLNALVSEPRIALAAGPDGLDALRIVVGGAPAHLVPGGWLLVEHGFDQGDAVRRLFDEAGFRSIKTIRDLAGHERVTLGQQ